MSKIPLTYNAFQSLLMEDSERGMKAVGHALVALMNLQTADEKRARESRHHNKVGFSGVDARIGMDNALFYEQYGFLEPIMLRYWRKPDKYGNVRICKYIEQLLTIARKKAGIPEPQAVQLRLPL
jgi:hypothetical protein